MRFAIKLDVVERMKQQAVAAALQQALSRFSADADDRGFSGRLARAVAESAVEQFAAWANSELRMIDLEYERRSDEAFRQVPLPRMTEQQTKDFLCGKSFGDLGQEPGAAPEKSS